MHILILLALVSFPEQISKVVLNTGVSEAEFYLDATFVAVTDKNGTLVMEDFPAGTFSFVIKKRGYKTYRGSFAIHEGEAKLLQPMLEKSTKPDEQTSKAARSSKPPGKKSSIGGNSHLVAKEAPSVSVPDSRSSNSVQVQSAMQIPQEKSKKSLLFPVLAFLIATGLLALGLWIWSRKRDTEQIPLPKAIVDIEDQDPPNSGSNRPEPLFIEELKRREEQLKAGFVGNRPPHIDQESKRGKEVVIVLPKEAYRYEEDK